MYTPSDIQSIARKIDDKGYELKNEENRFKGEIETVASWWKGDAYKSFEQGYVEAGLEINRLYTGINDLEDGLRKLALEVQRADEERIRIKAEKSKAKAEKSKA